MGSINLDDLGQACWKHMAVLRVLEDELGALLGMVYKKSKDVFHATTMKYIGFMIKITD